MIGSLSRVFYFPNEILRCYKRQRVQVRRAYSYAPFIHCHRLGSEAVTSFRVIQQDSLTPPVGKELIFLAVA